MTPAEILDACEHRQTRHPTYECCGKCNGACPDCVDQAIRAAVEAEKKRCEQALWAEFDVCLDQHCDHTRCDYGRQAAAAIRRRTA